MVTLVMFMQNSFTCYANDIDLYNLDSIDSESYILMNADTGEVILSKNQDDLMLPAQTTKVMTIALFLSKYNKENFIEGNDKITISYEMANIPSDSQQIWLRPGEEIQIYNLLMATEIKSANDAANALAIIADGQVDKFVADMNKTAKDIGCTLTHFDNPHGYTSDSHYTTAHDLALITAWALKIPGFKYFFQTEDYVIPATNKVGPRYLNQQNIMMPGQRAAYEGIIGGKPGWTREQKFTLVEVAERNSKTLIAVCMKCSGMWTKFQDARILLDYGFRDQDIDYTDNKLGLIE